MNAPPRTRIVGLIREPVDWYASYYYFRRNNVSRKPPSRINFPPTHPISLYSLDGTCSVSGMIFNMAAPQFFERYGLADKVACVYAADWPDALAFIRRTGTGFWTWTLIHHFSRRPTTALRTRGDVVAAARDIAKRVRFIRQETLDATARRLFGSPCRDATVVPNAAPRPDRLELLHGTAALAEHLDGDVARILGGYHVFDTNLVREARSTANPSAAEAAA